MATQVLRGFSSPEILKNVSRHALFRLLRPFGDYLRRNDLPLPEFERSFTPDYERLAALFAAADDGIPHELAEGLFLIDGLATAEGMDKLLQAFPDLQPAWYDFTPADVAVVAWLQDRDAVERVFAEMQVRCRSRSFLSFPAGERPLPVWQRTDAVIAAVEREIDHEFRSRGRGDGTRVIPTGRDGETWFLVRHGEPLRREGCIQDGESASVFFRPERYDAVVLDAARGELRVSATSRWQKELYRRVFGRRLFGSEEFFPGSDKYTLDPLIDEGEAALSCPDVPGLVSVTLVRLEYAEPSQHGTGTAKWGDDLFAAMREEAWSVPAGARLTQARFQVRLAGTRSPRSVTIIPPNVAKFTLDCDGMLVEQWLEKRGFVTTSGTEDEGDDHADIESLLACA
ncbi:MAG: hypothetical protein ACE5KM_24290 [Planctomycetaceae bacterium]